MTLKCWSKYILCGFIEKDANSSQIRRTKLISTKEWNDLKIDHISENELSEENIQNEIDSIGRKLGRLLWVNKRTTNWTDIAVTQKWCEVRIRQNV